MAWGALAATVLAPDPAVARYVLALPALLLALAAPRAAALPARWRPWLGALAGALGARADRLRLAGADGGGSSAPAYARMSDAERAGPSGPTGRRAVHGGPKRVGPGETFAFDQSLELPYLAWESDLRYRAVWIPDTLQTSRAVEDFLESENVRIVAVDEDSPTGEWLTQNPERFLKLFQCKSAPCSVFARR